MIAHIREPKQRRSSSSLTYARRLVAATLLPPSRPKGAPRRVPAWKLWLFACWFVLTAAAYLAYEFGLLP